MNAAIRLAEARDLDQLAELFDQYRQFYECPPDLGAAKNWLAENLERGRSTLFAADNGSQLLGFTQLYPRFARWISSTTLYCTTFMWSRRRGDRALHAL